MKFALLRRSALALSALLFAPSIVEAKCSGDLTITRTQDLSTLAACSTHRGSVTVQSISIPLPTNAFNAEIKLDGVEKITGDLVFQENSASRGALIISAPKLKNAFWIIVQDMTKVEMPQFPKLEKVTTITFRNVSFQHNTALNSKQWPALQQFLALDVIDTTMTKIGGWDRALLEPIPKAYKEIAPNSLPMVQLNVRNNPSLNEISLQGFSNSTSGITARIQANGKDLEVNFPQFEHSILWMHNVAQFSAPDMKSLTINSENFQTWIDIENKGRGNPGFIDNIFTNLDLPKLVSIDTQIDISNNTYLSDLNMPALATVNTLSISNNPELQTISLPELDAIAGHFNISGSFDSISLPKLTDTTGDLLIRSTNGEFSCADLNSRQEHSLFIKGKYSCSTRSTDLSTGAKAGIGVGIALAALATIALCGYLWIRYRRKRATNLATEKPPDAKHAGWSELDGESAKLEAGGHELQELEGKSSQFDTASSIVELESPYPTDLSITPSRAEFPYVAEKD